MSKHSYIVDILERRATYCGEKTAACGTQFEPPIFWGKSPGDEVGRIWIESVTVSKIARKIEIQKWPYLKKDIDLHSLQNCTALQHCCDIVSKWKQPGRYSTNKIQLIFIKHSDVVAWVVFVTLNIGAFIIFTSWILGFTASHSRLLAVRLFS